jgi:Rad52/22 family double-strand break repair protein
MTLSERQIEQLLKPINPRRVAQRKGGGGKSLAYVEAYDIKAHMIRMFGFGGWSWDVLSADLVFEEKGDRNWEVGYRVIGRLTVHAATEQRGMVEGSVCDRDATYTEAAVGIASLPSRGEAHDMAVKTGESDAFKRAAISLGDQFGLSLYNGGSTNAVVRATLDGSEAVDEAIPTVTPVEDESPVSDAPAPDPAAEIMVSRIREAMNLGDVEGIVALRQEASKADMLEAVFEGKTVAKYIDLAMVFAGKVKAGREALDEISEEVPA